jgi:uncharacterized membrane protein HdeD (DUF308 family)
MAYTVITGPFPEPPENLRRVIESLRPRWRWIVALGVLIAGLGVAALLLVVSATIASVYTIAVFMIVAGAAEIATGLGAKTGRRFVVWICGTCLYRRRGFCACSALDRGGLLYFAAGRGNDRDRGCPDLPRGNLGARCEALFCSRECSRRWLVLIVAGWPANSFRDLGVLLGLDLAFWGAAWIEVRVALAALSNRR